MSCRPEPSPGSRWSRRKSLIAALMATAFGASGAAEVVVRVSGLGEPLGQVAK